MKYSRYVLAIVVSSILAGTLGAFIKLIGDNMNGFSITFFRILIAAIALGLYIVFVRKESLKLSKVEIKHILTLGFLLTLAFTLYSLAILLAPISNVALLQTDYVIFTAIFAYLFLKEKIMFNQVLAIPIAIFGIWLMNPFVGSFSLGNLVALLHGAAFAGVLVYMRKESKHLHSLLTIFWAFVTSVILLLPITTYFGFGDVMSSINYLLMIGIFGTAITYSLLYYGLEKVQTEQSAFITLFVFTLSSIGFAYLIVGEIITQNILLGGSLLFGSALLALWKYDLRNVLS